ncbi:MAG: hypothetical protein QM537_08495 [Candidatus Symbiobacter sp.]|nr:hypothetical protein [Candidatus Symbiobacter sp.]
MLGCRLGLIGLLAVVLAPMACICTAALAESAAPKQDSKPAAKTRAGDKDKDKDKPAPAASKNSAPENYAKNLSQILDVKGITGAVYPADHAMQSINPTFSIYRLVVSPGGELLLAYGYATRDRQSVYRVWSLTAKVLRFEMRTNSAQTAQIMGKLRDYLAPQTLMSWPIRSLATPLAVSPERRIVLHNEGVCGGPYRYWLEWQGAAIAPPAHADIRIKTPPENLAYPSFGRMLAYRPDAPIPYIIPHNCPLTLGSEANGDNLSQTVNGKLLTLDFAQAVQLGNGAILAFAANAPVMIRFDAAGRSNFSDPQLRLTSTAMSRERFTEIINLARSASGRYGSLPLLARFEANFSALLP